MKKITFLVASLLFLSVMQAQKVYFVYLQSENQQPFYSRMRDKIYNSNPSGYLILSNLRDSNYTIHIGIQGNQAPDQPFPLTINKKDQGYLLKNFGEKGWGLFNLQSTAVVMPVVSASASTVKTEKREVSEFTDLLAKASDDSTIKERPVITKTDQVKTPETTVAEKKEVSPNEQKEVQTKKTGGVKTESVPSVTTEKVVTNPVAENKLNPAVAVTGVAVVDKKEEKTDTISSKKETNAPVQDSVNVQENKSTDVTKTDSVTASEKYIKSTITLHAESSTTQGSGLTFLDVGSDGVTDTIKILIPHETKKIVTTTGAPEPGVLINPIPVDSIKQAVAPPAVIKNKNCTQDATDDDFFKLRKRMASESSDDNMIAEAKKVFKSKCFSTRQVKNLGSLFLTDEGRYKFFDAAYAYVSDLNEFPSLQTELKEEYYINRFKAMLRQ